MATKTTTLYVDRCGYWIQKCVYAGSKLDAWHATEELGDVSMTLAERFCNCLSRLVATVQPSDGREGMGGS